jgi:hypothetical protein
MQFQLQGKASAYFETTDKEVLNESGARTGKTHSELVKAWYTAEHYPGSRQLFARETRKALTETVLPDFEAKVLGYGHPAIGKARRNNRDAYHFSNGSTIVLHGLDDANNILSGEFDRIYVFQAEQIQQATWDKLLSRLSGSATPYRQATADANPGPAHHWLIKRAKEVLCLRCAAIVDLTRTDCQACGSTALGRMRHFQYRHVENPLWFNWETQTWTPRAEEYIVGTLGRLRGVDRKRMLEHLWVSEEGQVLADFNADIHCISGELSQLPSGAWLLKITSPGWQVGAKDPWKEAHVVLDWFGAGADWGFLPAPGVFQVWGYDRFGRRFRVVEVYKTEQQMDWWAGVAHQLYQEFKYRYIAVDPSANALREAFNRRLALDHHGPAIAISADNTIRRQNPDLAGIDLMRWGLLDPNRVVRTYLLKGALRYGVDPALKGASRPTCLEEEIPGWVFDKKKSTDELIDKPVKENDHGCFVAGTPVLTRDGERAIEVLLPGDEVLTPVGFRPIDRAGLTKRSAPLWRITFAGGELVGTYDHRVWTDRGWKPLQDLMPGDAILRWQESNSALATASSGGAILTAPLSLLVRTLQAGHAAGADQRACTGTSGCVNAVQSRADTTFTTRTKILVTTPSAISNALLLASTPRATRRALGARKIWQESAHSRPGGTDRRPAGVGIARMAVRCGPTKRRASSPAESAQGYSRASDNGSSSVLLPAGKQTIEGGILYTTAVISSAAVSGTRADVYCVRVPGEHVIFAACTLVAQCDAWRYEAGEGWGVRLAATLTKPKYPEGSAGEIHRHEEKMAKARAWRQWQQHG